MRTDRPACIQRQACKQIDLTCIQIDHRLNMHTDRQVCRQIDLTCIQIDLTCIQIDRCNDRRRRKATASRLVAPSYLDISSVRQILLLATRTASAAVPAVFPITMASFNFTPCRMAWSAATSTNVSQDDRW